MTGGKPLDRKGYFYPPTVLTNIAPGTELLHDEIFGRWPPSLHSTTRDEVIELANSTEYGLVSYVYTQDLAKGLRVSERLDSGMVALNRGLVSDPAAPFGGTKQSGLGREGAHHGLLEFHGSKIHRYKLVNNKERGARPVRIRAPRRQRCESRHCHQQSG